MGKTRLGLAAAEKLTTRFADGVVFVPLAPLSDPALVEVAVAGALDVREAGDEPLQDVLRAYLRPRHLLLVLDNFEHVLGGAGAVAAMLAAAPRLAVLATSRSPLRLRAEHAYPVQPLRLGPAVELFEERARRAAPGASGRDGGVIVEICRRLDRLPLAIELAAARTRLLQPAELLTRLDAGLRILADGARDLPERQRTLAGTIAWSYDQLGPSGQAMFRTLGVFAGGWTAAAAAAVCDVDVETALDRHAELLDASLIGRESGVRGSRFGLLETIRAFALEQSEASGELETVRDRHAAHYLGVAARSGGELLGPGLPDALDRLELDHHNIQASLHRLLVRQRLEDVSSVCFDLWLFWVIRGHAVEAQQITEAALSASGSPSLSGRARLLFAAASMLLLRGRYPEATARSEEATTAAREAADGRTLCWSLTVQAYIAVYAGRPERAAPLLAEAAWLNRTVGEPFVDQLIAMARAHVAAAAGRLAEAERVLDRCERTAREAGAPWTLAVALSIHAHVGLLRGDPGPTQNLLREAILALASIRDTWSMAHVLTQLACAVAIAGEGARAAELFGAADAVTERTGGSIWHRSQEQSAHYRAVARTRLGPRRFEDLRQKGSALPLDAVVKLATR